MSSEEQEILAKISQLAGQINRHKNALAPVPQTQSVPTPNDYPASSGWRPSRGGYPFRGARGGRPSQIHRNKTLVLNGNSPVTTKASSTNLSDGSAPTLGEGNASAPAWITKTDRHLQLINTSVFEKESQQRAKAIEETRQQKLKQRDEREKLRFSRHLHRTGGNSYSGPTLPTASTVANYEINVQGVHFRVAKGGSKLVKVPGDLNAAKATPKMAIVGGVRFFRSKRGNMYRSGIIKAYRKSGVVKKVDEPCKLFTTTGTCLKGPRCRYIHDAKKVAVCKVFLQKGACPSGDSCDLSHELTPERTPTCLHFAKGNCSNPNCRYSHIRVSPTALVCRPFGIYGYCEKGSKCKDRHVHECPDFSNTGTCSTKGCKLTHRHKASVMRSNAVSTDQSAEDEDSDISSDDEEAIDSDDVDSDDLDEEFFGDEDGNLDTDIPMQQDYVQLS